MLPPLLLLALAPSIHGYAHCMCGVNPTRIDPTTNFCTVPVEAGRNIPGMGLMSINSASVRVISVTRGSTALSTGATYTPGETLTVSFPRGSATSSQGLLDVASVSMGMFSSGDYGLCCGGKRVDMTSSTTKTFTVSATATGPITIQGAWSNGNAQGISIAPSFVLNQVGNQTTSVPTASLTPSVNVIQIGNYTTSAPTFTATQTGSHSFSSSHAISAAIVTLTLIALMQ